MTMRCILFVLALATSAFEPVTTAVLRGGDGPTRLSVDVTGLDELWLLATSGEDDYHCDRAIWAEPVLVTKTGERVPMPKPDSAETGWGKLMVNAGLDGQLKIGKQRFERGFFAHAPSALKVKLNGAYTRFEVAVGIETAAGKKGSSRFRVLAKYDDSGMAKYPKGRPVTLDEVVETGPDADALRRAIEDLITSFGERYPQGKAFLERLAACSNSEELGKLQREALMANPLLDFDELLLVRRKAAKIGMPANWQSNSSLPKTGYGNDIATLSLQSGEISSVFRPEGDVYVGEVDLHFDAQKMLFSMPSKAGKGAWHIFECGIDGSGLRQISQTEEGHINNYDACYLTDDRIMFTSTAPCVAVPCVRGSSVVATMFRMNADGSDMRQLCFDQEHSWNPELLHDGRILYARWEYADLPHSNSRMLFTMNPDGSNQRASYGSSSFWPNSIFYARPVPGHASKIAGIVTGHHGARRTGELLIFDPAKGSREAEGVVQRIPGFGKEVEPVIEDRLTHASWPKFLHPFPLSENYYLVSMQPSSRANWGIYLVDVFDNLLLLKEEKGYALLEPQPKRARTRPPVIPDRVDPSRKDATVVLSDIYHGPGLAGVPRGEVKKLRLYTYTFGYSGVGGLYGSIGMDGPWDMRRILGTVPVTEDGSAVFRVPANTPIAMQPLDSEGKALQIMRSWFTAMPGERLSCVGCHEERQNAPPMLPNPIAFAEAMDITPWHGPARNFEFAREVQPVIDRHCLGCHNEGQQAPDLRGDKMLTGWTTKHPGNTGGGTGGKFSLAYANLHRYVRRPGIESPMPVQTPLEFHADTTELVQMLDKGHHGVQLDAKSWDRLITWIDFNAPYHGRWSTIVGDSAKAKEEERARMRERYANVSANHEELPKAVATPTAPVLPVVAKPPKPAAIPPPQPEAITGQPRSILLADGIEMHFQPIPAGEFVMGSHDGYADESPPGKVRIPQAFWMGRMEVTNAQFRCFDPTHDSREEDRHGYQFGIRGYDVNGPTLPAVRLSWQQAQAFCEWLSEKSGYTVALPTEAEWEWACRAGSATPFSYGDLDSDFSTHANLGDARLADFSGNPYEHDPVKARYGNANNPFDNWIPQDGRFDDGGFLSVAVGSYKANAWGLHDMHGNVAEWTRSRYLPYPYSATHDKLEASGKRVIRGGSWYDRPKRCTSSFRYGYRPYQKVYNVGFRVTLR
jgi:formylglycine-generating enzyme required for sulfatase activity